MTSQIPRPPLNPDLAEAHKTTPLLDIDTPEKLHSYRATVHPMFTLENAIRGKEATIATEELEIPGPIGPLHATVLRPKNPTRTATETPGVLHIHGGGLATGTRFLGYTFNDWIEELGAVIVTAEYRLAPEHPAPAGLEDSYAGLVWMAEHAVQLGFNPDKLIIGGGSAGGNIAAGLALLARDRGGPKLAGQVLMYPWVDDSLDWHSTEQFGDIAPVTWDNMVTVSKYAFGAGHEYADMYTAPLRAAKEKEGGLAGLPPTYLDVGEADVFRDQDVAYASALWKGGVSTELHVWPGAWHGFDVFVPGADVSQRAIKARLEWLKRVVGE
ncbi:alpha/beta hydrolase fold protein [Aspergillus pseudoustus]|uniref:Alpha/beta hydrolase fold protein n=1 Tax=Aspergillus pseudoustus TaxID=1810923 RepID=A0ABR4JKG2_9EURO